MDPYETLASFKRRRKAIAAEMKQMRIDEDAWNAMHPDEQQLNELEGMEDEAGLPELDAKIAVMERKVRGMSGGGD